MKLSADEANQLRYDDESDNWSVVARQDIDEGRWYSYHEAVLLPKAADVVGYWAFSYDVPLTENQEEIPFEDEVELYQLWRREVVKVMYVDKP
jgi:hypothetical protein